MVLIIFITFCILVPKLLPKMYLHPAGIRFLNNIKVYKNCLTFICKLHKYIMQNQNHISMKLHKVMSRVQTTYAHADC